VIFSEFVRGRNGTSTDGLHQVYSASMAETTANTTTSVDVYVQGCLDSKTVAKNSSGNSYDHKGQKWLNENANEGGPYSHIMLPNTKACWFAGNTGPGQIETLVGASSYHAGGVNIGMLDGSVRFVKNSINKATWRAISTKAGGEVISSDSL